MSKIDFQAELVDASMNYQQESYDEKNDFSNGDFTITGYWKPKDSLEAYMDALKVIKTPDIANIDEFKMADMVVKAASQETILAFLRLFRDPETRKDVMPLVNHFAELLPKKEGEDFIMIAIATDRGVYTLSPNDDVFLLSKPTDE